VPYAAYYAIFYIQFFSIVKHKEERFLLPAWQFLCLMLGDFLVNLLKKRTNWWWVWAIWVKVWIFFECQAQFCQEFTFRQMYKIRHDIRTFEPPVEAVFLSEQIWTPDYTLLHKQESEGNATRIYHHNQNPMFFRQMTGWPLPLTLDRKLTFCTQLVERLVNGEIRPQYITFEMF